MDLCLFQLSQNVSVARDLATYYLLIATYVREVSQASKQNQSLLPTTSATSKDFERAALPRSNEQSCAPFNNTYRKDGASFCYCAYVLCISGYSACLRNLPTNATIFLRGLRLCGKNRSK